MICEADVGLRCALLSIVTMGLYSAKHPRKTNFTKKWKTMLKIEKLKHSCAFWIGKMGLAESNQNALAETIAEFLTVCWKG